MHGIPAESCGIKTKFVESCELCCEFHRNRRISQQIYSDDLICVLHALTQKRAVMTNMCGKLRYFLHLPCIKKAVLFGTVIGAIVYVKYQIPDLDHWPVGVFLLLPLLGLLADPEGRCADLVRFARKCGSSKSSAGMLPLYNYSQPIPSNAAEPITPNSSTAPTENEIVPLIHIQNTNRALPAAGDPSTVSTTREEAPRNPMEDETAMNMHASADEAQAETSEGENGDEGSTSSSAGSPTDVVNPEATHSLKVSRVTASTKADHDGLTSETSDSSSENEDEECATNTLNATSGPPKQTEERVPEAGTKKQSISLGGTQPIPQNERDNGAALRVPDTTCQDPEKTCSRKNWFKTAIKICLSLLVVLGLAAAIDPFDIRWLMFAINCLYILSRNFRKCRDSVKEYYMSALKDVFGCCSCYSQGTDEPSPCESFFIAIFHFVNVICYLALSVYCGLLHRDGHRVIYYWGLVPAYYVVLPIWVFFTDKTIEESLVECVDACRTNFKIALNALHQITRGFHV